MSSYRRALLIVAVISIGLTAALPFLSQSEASSLTFGILLGGGVADVIATLVIARIVATDSLRPRSWLLLLLLTTVAFSTVGLVLIDTVLLLPAGTLPPGVGRLLAGMGVTLIAASPVMKAIVFVLVRKQPVTAAEDAALADDLRSRGWTVLPPDPAVHGAVPA